MAIAGASSLRGKELKELLGERTFPASDIRLLDDAAIAGTLTEAGGEATLISAVSEESFEGIQLVFFASTPEFAQRHWPEARRAGATVIDLTGTLAEVPTAIPWIPSLENALSPPQLAVGKLFSSPRTATLIACTLAGALRDFSVARLVIVFFQPVSERGQAGIDELESQTVKLLSFQPISREVYDAQVAFNLLGRYGEASLERLSDVRASLAREVARYLAGRATLPAIHFVQAPVFYSYVFAAYAELAMPRGVEELERSLASAGVKIEGSGESGPSNVSVAGESQVVACVEQDPHIANGYWIWGAADNVRLAAANALAIAEKLLAA